MFTNTSTFTKVLLKATVKITIAGFLIGFLHQYDWLVALILFIKIAVEVYNRVFKNKNYLFLVGVILTCIAGLIGEYWGVSNGFWEYHDVNRNLPLWLPFAWMLAFSFLYKLEVRTIPLLKDKSLRISDVCYEIGYEDQSAFSRAFKKRYGYAPSDLRKKALNKDK